MQLVELIDKLFENIEKLWNQFSKDKETIEPKKITDTETLYPKHTYMISFPAETGEYSGKIRSRNIKVALARLMHLYPVVNYKGKTYSPKDYPDLQLQLELNGDFDFKKI